jgi:tRNA (guanine-N(7)-)-methyltransferase
VDESRTSPAGASTSRSCRRTKRGSTAAGAPRFDPRTWFGRPELPFELEIGSGKGTFLLQEAAARPEANFLGIEWAKEFWRYAADRLRRHAVPNARMLRADATEFVRFRVPDGIVEVIHLYFSDPWPKSRHHKRRVVQDASLREFHRVLAPGGELRIVTDHDELWLWCEEHAAKASELFARRQFDRPRQRRRARGGGDQLRAEVPPRRPAVPCDDAGAEVSNRTERNRAASASERGASQAPRRTPRQRPLSAGTSVNRARRHIELRAPARRPTTAVIRARSLALAALKEKARGEMPRAPGIREDVGSPISSTRRA